MTEKDAKNQRARGQLVKQMGKRIPEKDRKKRGQFGKKHKRESVQHEMVRTQSQFAFVNEQRGREESEDLLRSGGSGSGMIHFSRT